MILASQILLGFLVTVAAMTILALGSPRRAADHTVAWYLLSTVLSGLLIDGLFLSAFLGYAQGRSAMVAFLAFLALRGAVSCWLLWMVVRRR